ncbi:hypothetical protein N8I77_003625 [Diaporthe amygdali]|uniref:Amidohydrolase-related domain-containing protein n=1 Tax=Phomopsis amygdali TaxID=1214568 RepID=A0AAD9SJA7_PHOAM|nr:hypothetical protein N8I77_003625 [Diaporthe amygdali]
MYGLLCFVVPLLPALVEAATTHYQGGTIVAFDRATEGLRVIRDGCITVTGDTITEISETVPGNFSSDSQIVNITGKIVTPGFIDTHRHGWQTAMRTIGSNTSLVEYFSRFGEFAAAGLLTPDDVYISQLMGLYEAQAAGVTTTLDHAHHTWSNETAEAGLQASIDSSARVFWCYTFHNVTNYTITEQLANFRDIATKAEFANTSTTLGIAYDSFDPDGNLEEIRSIMSLADQFDIPLVTSHSLQGPWQIDNSPEDLHSLGYLNGTRAVVLSHASFLTSTGAALLRSTNQYISVTPESEMHYGHTHPKNYYFQEQAALGVDTHFTFSTDILTQARIWLQQARYQMYSDVIEQWALPVNNPESVNQAFLLATRNGGLALRREDLGVIEEGAKADLVFWDGDSPALLGWVDPVAAVILHASVGDIDTVLVGGNVVKKGGKLVVEGYDGLKGRFLRTARSVQQTFKDRPLPSMEVEASVFSGNFPLAQAQRADVLRGSGDGYGANFW